MFKKIISFFKQETLPTRNSFVCPCCGLEQHEFPALTYSSPVYYDMLSDIEKNEIAEISSDFCIIRYPDVTNYFIRCVLFQDIVDSDVQLNYGIWVSLSEKSFMDYTENYNNKNREGGYFGWIANNLAVYDQTSVIPADVYLGNNGNRPEVVPHQSFECPFVHDYYSGITMQEAHMRIKKVLGRD